MFITQRQCVSLGEEIDWRHDEYLVTSGWNDKLDLYNVPWTGDVLSVCALDERILILNMV